MQPRFGRPAYGTKVPCLSRLLAQASRQTLFPAVTFLSERRTPTSANSPATASRVSTPLYTYGLNPEHGVSEKFPDGN